MAYDVRALLAYFEEAAQVYETAIEPALGPLAEGLVAYAALSPGERVIDLGSGTGLAARYATHYTPHIVTLDLSHRMITAARRLGIPGTIQGDMHRLPLPDQAFNAALAAFSFNSTDPRRSFPEAFRILKPGGRLVLQEWGTVDPLSDLLDETLAEYTVEEPPPGLAAQRAAQQAPHPWDEMETSDDIAARLAEAGFEPVTVDVVTPVVMFSDVETFIRYKLAWPIRRAELAAMPRDVQMLCLGDLQENLGARAGKDGRLAWEPNLVRIKAVRPANPPRTGRRR